MPVPLCKVLLQPWAALLWQKINAAGHVSVAKSRLDLVTAHYAPSEMYSPNYLQRSTQNCVSNEPEACLLILVQGSGPGEGLSEDVARSFFQQLILAVNFCQKLGIANR